MGVVGLALEQVGWVFCVVDLGRELLGLRRLDGRQRDGVAHLGCGVFTQLSIVKRVA